MKKKKSLNKKERRYKRDQKCFGNKNQERDQKKKKQLKTKQNMKQKWENSETTMLTEEKKVN